MSNKSTSKNPDTVGSRAAIVRNFKTLKSPEEEGTKKEYEYLLEKVQNHFTFSWEFGKDTGQLLKHMKDPTIRVPTDITSSEEAVKGKVRI